MHNAPRTQTWGVVRGPLFLEREQPSIGLHKPRVVPLALDVAEQGRIERRVRRLAARAGPIALLSHAFDHLLGGQGLFGFGEYLCGGIDGAEFLVTDFGGRRLGGGNLSGGSRLLHFRFPRRSLRSLRGHVYVPS